MITIPNYDFYCSECDTITEKNLPISQRDDAQVCECGTELKRKITFKGSVWAPTASSGATHR